MAREVSRVYLAARPSFCLRCPREHACAAQPVKTFANRTPFARENFPHRFAQLSVLGHKHENPPQVIPVNPIVAIGLSFQIFEADFAINDFVQATTRQVRLAAHQSVKASPFTWTFQRRSKAFVQIRQLVASEVLQTQARSDIERRLI